MSPIYKWVFSAQDSARKVCPEPSGDKLSESVLKILYVVCSPNGYGKCPSTQFLENDEIVFHLAAMSPCESGGLRVVYGTQLMQIRSNVQLMRIRVNSNFIYLIVKLLTSSLDMNF